MLLQNLIENLFGWILDNLDRLISVSVVIVIIIVLYYILKSQINRLKRKDRLDESNARNLIRLLKIISYTIGIIMFSLLFAQELAYFTGIISIAGGTVIGFAAMNTLGNLIAGIIIVTRKPFQVGDRILYKNRVVDVIDIKLVFTEMEDLNRVKIFVPNQKVIKQEIENFGKEKILRRELFVTIGYEDDPRLVEKALLEVASKFTNLLTDPAPRVDMYEFLNYSIKYRLLVFIKDSRIIPKIDYDLKKAIYYSFKDYGLEIVTPTIMVEKRKSKMSHVWL
ncbi:MAG: mechanosensitive ion channel [Candidatus Lokiarchaeota archaeon]